VNQHPSEPNSELCTCPGCLLARKHPKVMQAYNAFANALNEQGVPHADIHFTAISIASAWLTLLRGPECDDTMMDSHVMAAVATGRTELAPLMGAALAKAGRQ
jgi:hypothetical protein